MLSEVRFYAPAVPEPSTWALGAIAIALIAVNRK
jgi:hypothetical protein